MDGATRACEATEAAPDLYTSLAVLHGADLATTATILERGGVERNPLMRPVVGNTASSIAVKAATSAVAIYFAEKAWRKSKVAAIVTMLAVNGLTAAVVATRARDRPALEHRVRRGSPHHVDRAMARFQPPRASGRQR